MKLTDLLKDIELGKVYTDKDRPAFKVNESMKRFKVYVSGESKPLILMGKNEKEVKKTAYAMIRNSSVKIKRVVKEGGPGSGPHGDDEDNPFDKEPSDDDLRDIEKQFEGKLTEKKKMDQKYLDKVHKLTQYNNHTESRILVAKLVGDKKLMKAYEGLKAVQDYMGRANEIIKPRTYLDLKLKDAIGRKFLNSAEIWGLL